MPGYGLLFAGLLSASFVVPVFSGSSQVRVVVKDSVSHDPLSDVLVEYVVGSDTTRLFTDEFGVASGDVTSLVDDSFVVPSRYGFRVFPSVVGRGGVVRAEVSGYNHSLPLVRVYDVLGRDVSGVLEGVSSGVYFLSVVLGGDLYSQKVFSRGGFSLETVLKSVDASSSFRGLSKVVGGGVVADVFLRKEGYVDFESSELLFDDRLNEFDYFMSPAQVFVVRGSVWNQTGDFPLSGASVFFKTDEEGVREVVADGDGFFSTSYFLPGDARVKVWSRADGFTNGTLSVLDPDTFAIHGIVASAAPFAGPDTAEASLEDLAVDQGLFFECLSDEHFYDNIFREMAGGRISGHSTFRRNDYCEIYVLTYHYATKEPLSEVGLTALLEVADYRVAEQLQANGLLLKHVFRTVNDTMVSASNSLYKQILRFSNFAGNGFFYVDDEGYITRHIADTNTGIRGVITDEVFEEVMDEYEGTLGAAITDGFLNDRGRNLYHFIHTHPLGTRTPLLPDEK